MFAGIIKHLGRVAQVEAGADGTRLELEVPAAFAAQAEPGASVAVNGCCLTVAAVAAARLSFNLGTTTQQRTAPLRAGAQVHLEHSLRAGDPIDGHMVAGHVDGVATLAAVESGTDSTVAAFDLPPDLDARLVAVRGSVAVAGVSLTVAALAGRRFEVQLIAATMERTLLRPDAALAPGAAFNFEADMLARYALRAKAGDET